MNGGGGVSACHCFCGVVHPSANVCDPEQAMTTRPIVSRTFGPRDVPVCQPCAAVHDALGVLRERQQHETGPHVVAAHAGQPDYGGAAAVVVLALAALAVLAIGLAMVIA